MAEPIPAHIRRRRRRRRRWIETLLMALVPFLMLVLAGLLSLGIVDAVERSTVGSARGRPAVEPGLPPARRAERDELTLPGVEPEDPRQRALPTSVVEPEPPLPLLEEAPASPSPGEASLPPVSAGPAVVPEPGTALLVVGGLAGMAACRSGLQSRA